MLNEQFSSQSISRWYRRYILPGKKYIVTAIVLLMSAYLAFLGTSTVFMALLALAAAVVGAAVLYRHLQLGLLLLILVSFGINYTVGTGTQTSINATILLIGGLTALWLLDMILVKKMIKLADSPTILPLLLIIVVSILAFINGQLRWFNYAQQAPLLAQVGGLMTFIVSISAYLVVVHLLTDVIWLKRLVWAFIAFGGVFIITRFTPELVRFGNRTFAYGSTASIFWLWLPVLTASQGFFNTKLSKPIRAGLIALCLLTMYFAIVVAYDWKSGWLPPLAALAVIFWFGAPKLRPLFIPAVGLLILARFFNITGLVTGGEDYSVLTRVEALRILLEIIKVNPFLGLGPANYYWYTPLFPILGYNVSFNSHNNYIDIVAQIGIFGLLFFVWFFWELARTGLRMLPTAPEGFERAFVIGVLGGIAGTVVAGFLGDWIIPFVYNVGLVGFRSSIFGWVFLGALPALDIIQKKRAAQAAQS
jgi:hypothetical protein